MVVVGVVVMMGVVVVLIVVIGGVLTVVMVQIAVVLVVNAFIAVVYVSVVSIESVSVVVMTAAKGGLFGAVDSFVHDTRARDSAMTTFVVKSPKLRWLGIW
ncbi:hypothetical protein ElyMa_002892300 [Elysia marginata]|uniref:ABC transmembrane type-1 domain-containing protein n=1 Tax=Elysia marginata TaxID=1093978 RepID=A0AAV4I3T3_9GAST|nr:hypothetical protein ElyMa_002892300 [Elysia marginata]